VTNKTVIAAFDVATSVGVCYGIPGSKPTLVTWDLRTAGTFRPRRLLYFAKLLDQLFTNHKIDVVRFEAPLPLSAMNKIGTSEDVMLMLRGAIGVLEMSAAKAEVPDIGSFNVQDARKHLTGRRTFPKDAKGKSTAKTEVMRVARMLGVDPQDDNAADAFAGWELCCALTNPRIAHLRTPLFSHAKAVA